jgi:hypothetical protein
MWKPEHRRAADCNDLRYPSDLTDTEWTIVEPMIPPGRHGGRKRLVNVREVLNGIFYVLWTGCQWKALPKDLPPKSTVRSIPPRIGGSGQHRPRPSESRCARCGRRSSPIVVAPARTLPDGLDLVHRPRTGPRVRGNQFGFGNKLV